MLIYTRIVLILAAIGIVSSGVGGLLSIPTKPIVGLLSLLLAVAIGYFWVQDWNTLSKCIKISTPKMTAPSSLPE